MEQAICSSSESDPDHEGMDSLSVGGALLAALTSKLKLGKKYHSYSPVASSKSLKISPSSENDRQSKSLTLPHRKASKKSSGDKLRSGCKHRHCELWLHWGHQDQCLYTLPRKSLFLAPLTLGTTSIVNRTLAPNLVLSILQAFLAPFVSPLPDSSLLHHPVILASTMLVHSMFFPSWHYQPHLHLPCCPQWLHPWHCQY